MVATSLMPPNSAVLLISLTRISEIPSNAGNSSVIGPLFRALVVLMPSTLIETMSTFAPATEIWPLLSISTPGCVVSVLNALVEPAAREPSATGRSISSRPSFVSAILETSVAMGATASTLTSTI